MKAIISRKIGMTQMADDAGVVSAATLLISGPCVITQIKDSQKDGYTALQIGFGSGRKANKPMTGHLKGSKQTPHILREFRVSEEDISGLKVGDPMDIDQFELGDAVKLHAISKGKGFAGNVKRHHFNRGPVTHGSQNVRKPGSIGSMYPQRVLKGKRMAGRMGRDRTTIQRTSIIYIDKVNHIIGIRGPVPGPAKSIVCLEAV